MKVNKLTLLIIISNIICCNLSSISAKFIVKSLGLSVANITMDIDRLNKRMTINANSIMTNRMFPHLNNTYEIEYDKDFLPIKYNRDIKQSNFEDIVQVLYLRNEKIASMNYKHAKLNRSYLIRQDIMDVFSALSNICKDYKSDWTYYIDGNGVIWQAKTEWMCTEKIKTSIGYQRAEKVKITFSKLDKTQAKAPYIDMVTNNILNENCLMYLWISPTMQIPLKASVEKGIVNMHWEIVSIE